ncbi:hypothetical protein ABK040_003276 [Willaertia magna]
MSQTNQPSSTSVTFSPLMTNFGSFLGSPSTFSPSFMFNNAFTPKTLSPSCCKNNNHDTGRSSSGGGLSGNKKNFDDVFTRILEASSTTTDYHHHHEPNNNHLHPPPNNNNPNHPATMIRSPLFDMIHLFSPVSGDFENLALPLPSINSFATSNHTTSSSTIKETTFSIPAIRTTHPLPVANTTTAESTPTSSESKKLAPPKLQLPDLTTNRTKAKKLSTAEKEVKEKASSSSSTSGKRKKKATNTTKEEDQESVCSDEDSTSCNSNEDRTWQTVYVDDRFKEVLNISITSKTRCEEPSTEVPSKMYSSLKYEIRQIAALNKNSINEDLPFFLGRISMVDSQKFEEIQQDNKNNPVLKGVIESALTKKPESKSKSKNTTSDSSVEEYNGVLKVQSSTVSYHHKKINFCWQISYFIPSDLENAILVKRSAPFKVYARKPSQNKKRKRNTTTEQERVSTLTNFDDFANSVEELVLYSKKLKETEKKKSLELLSTKLIELDPEYFKELLESKLKDQK